MHHHAQLLVTSSDSFLTAVEQFLTTRGVVAKGNPDVRIQSFVSLGIDDARALKDVAYQTASKAGAESWHVLYIGNATHAAQNALLKVLEEPPRDTFFLIGVAHEEVLLPTVRSRLSRLDSAGFNTIEESVNGTKSLEESFSLEAQDAERFVNATLPERIEIVQPYFADRAELPSTEAFLDALERLGVARMQTSRSDATALCVVRSVIALRTFLYGSAPSKKLLLENLALQLPTKR